MRRKTEPLLCELHAHTTWSDGALSLPELVDLYGRSGFDVLAVTEHVNRPDDPFAALGVTRERHVDYVAAIAHEADRARDQYDLLLLAGAELSYNDADPFLAAHAVAVGLHSFVGLDDGLDAALAKARGEGAALIAAHPFSARRALSGGRATMRFARDWRELRALVDRWELFNRYDLFAWVAQRGLPAVANGDFHRPDHLHGWKTVLPCRKDDAAVVEYLRSARPAFLTRLDPPAALRRAA
ncbi:MAG TPA: PHP domain-containing protein [Gaiellaceae bacterium]|nr:PHP domain-containing protein [Gaiellaceae bacterium]